jgi:hypothetical protein
LDESPRVQPSFAWRLRNRLRLAEISANLAHALLARNRPTLLLAALLPGYILTTWHFGGPVIGMKSSNVLAGLIRAGFAYFIGVQMFRRFGDRPIRLPPAAGLFVFVVASYGLAWVPPTFAGPFFVLIVAPVLIRSVVALEESRWARLVGAVSFPLYATHAPISQLCFAMKVPILAAAWIALLVAAALALLWEPLTFSRRLPTPNFDNAARDVAAS